MHHKLREKGRVMRRNVLFVAAAVLSLGLSSVAAPAATTKPAVVKKPQLLIVQALNQADGQNYPNSAGKATFTLQLERGNTTIGYKAGKGTLNGFTPVKNWSPSKLRQLKVKLRVGDVLEVCWNNGLLVVPTGESECQRYTFSQADTKTPHVFAFTLLMPIPRPVDSK